MLMPYALLRPYRPAPWRAFFFALLLTSPGAVLGQTAAPETTPAAPAPRRPSAEDPPPTAIEYGGSAHVMRRDNTDIYLMSKPDRPFVVTGRLVQDDLPVMTDPISGQIILRGQTILEQVDALLAKARRQQIYYDFPYDALLTTDGSVGTFVRWRNRAASQAATPSELKTERLP